MRLTTFSDYSLRVLIYLGTHPERRATIREIAAAYDISRNHLMKVTVFLSSEGYVGTIRGKDGGLHLRCDPGEISVGDVIRKSEADSSLVECFSPDTSKCRIDCACRLKAVFHEAENAFMSVLDGYTLADLVRNRKALVHLMRAP